MRAYMIGLAGLILAAAVVATAQERGSDAAPAPAPRRDVSGVWLGPAVPLLQPPAPMTADGQALFDAAKPIWGPRAVPVAESNDPLVVCDPLGFPRAVLHELRGMEFVQSPDKVVQLLQYQRVFREIWTDGRPLPAGVGSSNPQSPDPRLYGYSIGRWVDDYTFVVDTTGAEETSFGDEYGQPHGLGAHVEERYRRVDGNTLEMTVTIDDPEMYQRPFIALRQTLIRGRALEEQLCIPSVAQRYLEAVAKPASRTP